MSPTQILIVIIGILVVAAVVVAVVAVTRTTRRRALRERFGQEYDRTVAESPDRTAAERELRDRERRHAELTLTPLSDDARRRYTTEWEDLQARFIDSPGEAVGAADELI